jgi:protein TonB
MFNAAVHRRERSIWSARTVAASVGAHLLVLGVLTSAETYHVPPECWDCGGGLLWPLEEPLVWPPPGWTPPDLVAAGTGPSQPGTAPQPSAGKAGLPPDAAEVFDPTEVTQLPQLLHPRATQRMLERVYPAPLRDAGVTGYTLVQLVIDRNGAVEPGSVTVQETTHDALREAAVRAAGRFRFRPARVNGLPVRVRISLPIRWTPPRQA